MTKGEPQDLRRLERKVDRLFWLVGAQTLAIALFAAHYFFAQIPKLALLAVAVLPALFLLRKVLPRWARWLGRSFGRAARSGVQDKDFGGSDHAKI